MYYNRDLSWLDFNYRVLCEAAKDDVPLYERVKFLSIFCSNLDEFFSVRYPVIMAISNLKLKTQRKIENEMPEHLLEKTQTEIERQLEDFQQILEQKVIPALAENNIVLYYKQPVQQEHVAETHELFLSRVLSFVQPLFLNTDMPADFEPEANKPYMIISLQKAGTKEMQHAIIRVPSDNLGSFFVLTPLNEKNYIIFIDDVIRNNVQYIFPGFSIEGVYEIKFNRNAELDIEDDYQGNILKKIEKQLHKRKHGAPSRFMYEKGMPRNMQLYLASVFNVNHDSIFEDGRYLNLKDLAALPAFNTKMNYNEWKSLSPALLSDVGDIFKTMEKKDMLLHFPYHSYNYILSFFNQAAIDPDVKEIYIALYRVAPDSLIANALISAARNGKKVTAFIELQARFDEANNISWSKKMKAAGVNIIYSIPGIKVHSKIALVTKSGAHQIQSYALVSTGNFNEQTAHFYTDHTLLTTDATVNAELLQLFNFLEQRETPDDTNTPAFKQLFVAPFNMVDNFTQLIDQEVKRARKTGKGLIRIKVNSLEEPGMIDALYRANKEGVEIRLIVRSICCLVPGVKGLSDNIHVKRLVGRYLEHSRLFIFGTDDEATVVMGSSDWMTRNLYHRIEVCTSITDAECRNELLKYFELQWNESDDLWQDKTAAELAPQRMRNAQLSIYSYLKEKL